jgi:hypothetical protein
MLHLEAYCYGGNLVQAIEVANGWSEAGFDTVQE